MRVILATRNDHKVREFAQLMAPHAVAELPAEVELPPETGTTFAENALIKARAAAFATGERTPLQRASLDDLLELASQGIDELRAQQQQAIDAA